MTRSFRPLFTDAEAALPVQKHLPSRTGCLQRKAAESRTWRLAQGGSLGRDADYSRSKQRQHPSRHASATKASSQVVVLLFCSEKYLADFFTKLWTCRGSVDMIVVVRREFSRLVTAIVTESSFIPHA